MQTIAICDDDPRDAALLHSALDDGFKRRGEKAQMVLYPCGEALLFDLEDGPRTFDLVFLDIYMTGITGMETARRLRGMGQKMPLVFLTTTPDFAVEGYEVAAAGYLLKPLDTRLLDPLLERLLTPRECPRLTLAYYGAHQYFDYSEIRFIESRGGNIFLHIGGEKPARCTARLDEVEGLLHDPRFLRCHQSYLVNMDYIDKAEGDFLLRDGQRVPIRVRSRKAMTDAYYRYFVEHTVTEGAEVSHV